MQSLWVVVTICCLVVILGIYWLSQWRAHSRRNVMADPTSKALGSHNVQQVPVHQISYASDLPREAIPEFPKPSSSDMSATIPPDAKPIPPRWLADQLKAESEFHSELTHRDPSIQMQYITSARSLLQPQMWKRIPEDAILPRDTFHGTDTRLDHEYYTLSDSSIYRAGPAAVSTIERASPNALMESLVTGEDGDLIGRTAGPGVLGPSTHWPHGDVIASTRNAEVDEMLSANLRDDVLSTTLFE